MNNEDPKCELISFAEAVRADSLFDISMDIDISRFFRVKFENDELETKNICNLIYKSI